MFTTFTLFKFKKLLSMMNNLLKLVCLSLLTFVVSCSDECDGVECGPGACNDGTCECPDAYEGTSCELLTNAKYFGNWSTVIGDCGAGNGTSIDSIEIVAHPNGNPTEVQVTTNSPTFSGTIDGTIVNGSLSASGDIGNTATTITGTFTSDTDLDSQLSAGVANCTISFEKM